MITEDTFRDLETLICFILVHTVLYPGPSVFYELFIVIYIYLYI